MKKYNCYTVVIITIVFLSCFVRKSEPITGRNFTPKNKRVAFGEQLFMANCNKCHPAGESGLGPSLNANPAPGFIKRFQMRHGLGVMPAFSKNELTHQDLKDIAKYLHAWKHY